MKKEKVVDAIKSAGELASEWGVQSLACGLCRLVLPPQVNFVAKCGVLLGGLIIGGCLGEHVNGYFGRQVDQIVNAIDESTERIKNDIAVIQEASEENKTETEKTDQTDQTNKNEEQNGEDLG